MSLLSLSILVDILNVISFVGLVNFVDFVEKRSTHKSNPLLKNEKIKSEQKTDPQNFSENS